MLTRLKQLQTSTKGYIGIPIVLLMILAMVILPLPPLLLDALFTFNIVLAILVLLVSTTAKRPLDFSVFPTILLVATLLRLTLNVASTRIVLLEGHNGGDAAGKVIQAFGEVVIGGNYVVGMVVFIILMIINFVVITKGGERISEVSARFTLDALPGKQMAIDADLNAGLIDQETARLRRKEVANEADFHGSMDGASKFVRGDAVAGLLILFINIIGGISIGVFEHGLPASEAFKTYALLTIGDGLVAQIPSLLLATAAAIIVTRINDSDNGMSETMQKQLLATPATLFTVAGIMAVIGMVPGMPHLAFFAFAGALGFAGWRQSKKPVQDTQIEQVEALSQAMQEEDTPLTWDDIPHVHTLSLALGYRLVHLVNKDQGAPLSQRIRGVRRNLSEQVGFLLPEVRIRDNLSLKPNQYTISLNGEVIEQGFIEPERLMAIAVGDTYGEIDGILGSDPAYQLPAVWIEHQDKAKALNMGYQVVDDGTVIATHISKIMKTNLAELFTHDDVEAMTQRLTQQAPKLAEALAAALNPAQQLKVYRQLLLDQVPLKDIRTIANTMLESSENTKDPILLAADVRCALKRTLVNLIAGQKPELNVYALSDELEQMLLTSLQQAQASGTVVLDSFPIEPNILGQFQQNLPLIRQQLKQQGLPPILLVMPQLRPLLARYARTFTQGLAVLSYNEIPENKQINVVGNLG
ncbi:flagellar biosynthesis protein FlhA [Vibrio parahaemolyticus]|uniref:Flagellar biosynthesis protein FlhA n=55 Tax=Gammaproteobacteria TaxID=1236 RepID=A0A0F5SXE4_VIBPH|nr:MULTISPECIES: flagellar biosynthesis protein FlhA [Vibrio]EFO35495.1 flagellar biosynthesis protein FlhA [Vibrio parahaemolyticus Peru-466]EFO46865.1 flagellar biosynthesis protein FlhA [Vibrio parahaemolyticus AQ4037]EFO49881.1 flagellar biosynthesis protein FlhA [Vibrio parahaemolyticus K5030]EJG0921102.1 flagellar biosynthesis protein FlhA [Vibrio parahaemolyticus O1:K68]EJG0930993.1 flagellar biosynthesis protein FlhA [Vibrio parahaemolyticus O1]EJG0944929.1 flagellar biosynthesis prot